MFSRQKPQQVRTGSPQQGSPLGRRSRSFSRSLSPGPKTQVPLATPNEGPGLPHTLVQNLAVIKATSPEQENGADAPKMPADDVDDVRETLCMLEDMLLHEFEFNERLVTMQHLLESFSKLMKAENSPLEQLSEPERKKVLTRVAGVRKQLHLMHKEVVFNSKKNVKTPDARKQVNPKSTKKNTDAQITKLQATIERLAEDQRLAAIAKNESVHRIKVLELELAKVEKQHRHANERKQLLTNTIWHIKHGYNQPRVRSTRQGRKHTKRLTPKQKDEWNAKHSECQAARRRLQAQQTDLIAVELNRSDAQTDAQLLEAQANKTLLAALADQIIEASVAEDEAMDVLKTDLVLYAWEQHA